VAARFRGVAALRRGGGLELESGRGGVRQGSGVAFIGQGRERSGWQGMGRHLVVAGHHGHDGGGGFQRERRRREVW
jgi:hypothetical protein